MTSVVFFGSSEYSVIVLESLLANFTVPLVVSKTDKPVGRDQIITPNPVAQFARNHHLPLLQIEEFTSNSKSQIQNSHADLGLCVAFGPPFFDQEMIDIFPHQIVNIHPSPLPKYRGATPGPWQIINGESLSAITFFQIDILPDHGPIISQIPFPISASDTAGSFYQKAFALAAQNLSTILSKYLNSNLPLTPQDHSQKTYFPKLSKETAQIDWTWDPVKINRFVRALLPWPVAWTNIQNQSGEILKMKVFSFDTEPNKVQIEGKTKTTWSQIKNYYTLL